MESGIANRLNSLCVLYCNLEKKFNDYLSKNETDSSIKGELEEIKDELIKIKINNDSSIKCELEEIKGEIKSIKEENNLSINRELEIVNGEQMMKVKISQILAILINLEIPVCFIKQDLIKNH